MNYHDSLISSGNDCFLRLYTPHAVHADRPGFQLIKDLTFVERLRLLPRRLNYLYGDIISGGMIDTEHIYKKNEISVFDIGTAMSCDWK